MRFCGDDILLGQIVSKWPPYRSPMNTGFQIMNEDCILILANECITKFYNTDKAMTNITLTSIIEDVTRCLSDVDAKKVTDRVWSIFVIDGYNYPKL